MHSLKPYNDRGKGLSDLLDWAALMDDGIVQGKSGALIAGWFYRGQDIASSTADERNYITQRINATLARLGGGWASWHDAIRLPSSSYPRPETSYFPDKITRMIDAERRTQFLKEGSHTALARKPSRAAGENPSAMPLSHPSKSPSGCKATRRAGRKSAQVRPWQDFTCKRRKGGRKQVYQTLISPGLCRYARPAPSAGFAISGL